MIPRGKSKKLGPQLLLCLMPLMQGCASFAEATQIVDPAKWLPTVNVDGNSYCKIAEKRTWHEKDTAATVTGVRKENAKIAKLCKK